MKEIQLFDLCEAFKVLKCSGRVRRSDWDENRQLLLIGDCIIYTTPSFTTEYKFSALDFEKTWFECTENETQS